MHGRIFIRGIHLLVASVVVSTSCTANDDGSSSRPEIWTPFEIHKAFVANTAIATDPSFPIGFLPNELMTPQPDGTAALNVSAAFAEGQPAAYVVTDVWRGFGEIWAQPWYFVVTAWNELAPSQHRLKDSDGVSVPPLVDVAPGSLFYSPFWVVSYLEVPPDSDPARYRSVKNVFDAAPIVHPGPLFTYAMRPDEVTLPKPKPTHPILGTDISGISDGPPVLYEGKVFGSINLGGNNFEMNAGRVVEEAPLFLFARRGPDGGPRRVTAPAVTGVGPLVSGRPAQMSASGPRLRAYYRITWAMLPATAEPFDPDLYPEAALLIAALSGDPAKPTDPRLYKGRVATNAFKAATAGMDRAADCFASPLFPASCQWLDSQSRVESVLGRNALVPTAITVAAAAVPVGAPR